MTDPNQRPRGAMLAGLGPKHRRAVVAAAVSAGLLPVILGATAMNVLPLADSQAANATFGANSLRDLRPGDVGANGQRDVNSKLSDEILKDAGDPAKLALGAGPLAALPTGSLGIPGIALDAYRKSATSMAVETPTCKVPWYLVASIGRIESGHARGGEVDKNGNAVTAILGPELNGSGGTAAIADTDGGRLDGDHQWDRAVGPMQFIPSTWQRWAADGNRDTTMNPHNIYDSSLAAARLLCASGGDLSQPANQARAVFAYNHSDAYVATVLLWAQAYAKGVRPVDVGPMPMVDGMPVLPAPNQAARAAATKAHGGSHPRPATHKPSHPPKTTRTTTPGTSSSSHTPTTTTPMPTCPPTTTPSPSPSPTTTPTPTTTTYPPGCPAPAPTTTTTPKTTPTLTTTRTSNGG